MPNPISGPATREQFERTGSPFLTDEPASAPIFNRRFFDAIANLMPPPQEDDFTQLNRSILQTFTDDEQKTLQGIGFDLTVSTERIGDFPIAGSRFVGVRQTVVSPEVMASGTTKPVPGSSEFGGGQSVRDILEHEMRHQLLQAEGIPPEQHHEEAKRRGGRFLKGLVGHSPITTEFKRRPTTPPAFGPQQRR